MLPCAEAPHGLRKVPLLDRSQAASSHATRLALHIRGVALQGMASHGVACSRRSRALYDLRNALSSVDELDELVTGLVVGSRAAREGATQATT